MGNKRFLTAGEQRDLIEFVAGKGENYQRYLEWCDANQVPQPRRYSESYFHKWVSKRRDGLRVVREQHKVEVRKASTLDKERRIQMLEGSIERLRGLIESNQDFTVEQLTKLEEQLGKMLDRVARERGEYGKQAPETDDLQAVNKALAEQALAALKAAAQSAVPALPEPAVEGQYRVVTD